MNTKEIATSCLIAGEVFTLPKDYVLKDENGNVINATKIVLEKKKPKYPTTYDDCHIISPPNYSWLLAKLERLLICRDAYWKIAGDEMGLGKPWEPDYDGTFEDGTPKNMLFIITEHVS